MCSSAEHLWNAGFCEKEWLHYFWVLIWCISSSKLSGEDRKHMWHYYEKSTWVCLKGIKDSLRYERGRYTHKYRMWQIQLQSPWKAGDQSHTASCPPDLVFTTLERAIPSVSPLKRLWEAPPLSSQGHRLCKYPLQGILDILLFSIVNNKQQML